MSRQADLSVQGAGFQAPSAPSVGAVVPQPAVAPAVSRPDPVLATASHSSSSNFTGGKGKKTSSSKPKVVPGGEDEEEIIPMKVPMSESDGEDDDEPARPVPTAASHSHLSPSGAREKTFLSEAALASLPPQPFPDANDSGAAGSAASHQPQREREEAELARIEASLKHRPRAEWSTDTSTSGGASSGSSSTEVFCLTWSPDSRFLAAGCGDGTIRVFNATTGRVAYLLRSAATGALGSSHVDESLPITCIRFRPAEGNAKTKGVLLAASADGSVTHWHMSSQTCLYAINEVQEAGDAQVYACDYRADGEQFATGGRDGKVRVYDESTKVLSGTLTAGRDKGTTGHSNRVYAVKYHLQDTNVLVSGGWDNTLQIWDVRAGYSVRSIYGPHICGDALDLSPDGSTILTASWRPNSALQRWDFASGKLIDTIPFAAGPGGLGADRPELLYACAFSPDGRLLAAGGCGTHESKLFDVDSARTVERISAGKAGVYCLAFSPSGKKFAMAGGGANVTVVDL